MTKPSRFLLMVIAGSVLGLMFSSVSTRDFAMHLDRQVHDVNCSFTPGLTGPETGESGCLVTMVSPYSSVLREAVWGGVPIALPAMAVFAFLMAFCAEILVSGRQRDPRVMAFLALASALPLAASLVMAGISLVSLDAICKICVGIYVSSALVFVGAIGAWLQSRANPESPAPQTPAKVVESTEPAKDPAWVRGGPRPATEPPPGERRHAPSPGGSPGLAYFGGVFVVGLAFVSAPVLAYLKAAPDHSSYVGTCGGLSDTELAADISLQLGNKGEVPAIEVLDPLCPACRLFETRLEQSGFDAKLNRRAVLFPLDRECNWMIDKSVHPGACAVSEAMLCAADNSGEVLKWSFAEQENILKATTADPSAAARMVVAKFPELASCIGQSAVKAKLNRGLRWAVEHQIQVLTPQLFVAGVKLCDEDVDLGLAFSLSVMIDRFRAGSLHASDTPGAAVPVELDDEEQADTEEPAPAPVTAVPATPAPATAVPPVPASATPAVTTQPAPELKPRSKADAGAVKAAAPVPVEEDDTAPAPDTDTAPAPDSTEEPATPGDSP